MTTQIYLVPGFFGFTELGMFSYFHRVPETLRAQLAKQGIDAEVFEVETVPTGSVRRRAARLIEAVEANGGLEADHLHFVGHSTGGLDIRMMLTPGVKLMTGKTENAIARLTRSAISLSTPHHGTPMANFFTSMNGRNLLLLLSLMATSGPGRYSIYAAARLLNQYSRLDHLLGQRDNILDSLAENLLAVIRPEKGDALWEYLRRISDDQGAMIQLTPEGMDLFNAAVTNRRGIDYVSFVTGSPAPSRRLMVPHRGDVYRPFTHLVYAICYQITAQEHRHYPYPQPKAEALAQARDALDLPLDAATNDGVVPTLSQFWGRLGGVYCADHMDVVGHFQHVNEGSAYQTWMMSGSGFNEARFEGIWKDIGETVAQSQLRQS